MPVACFSLDLGNYAAVAAILILKALSYVQGGRSRPPLRTSAKRRAATLQSFGNEIEDFMPALQFICFLRLRFTVPSVMAFRSRALADASATQEMASSAAMVWMPVRAVMSLSKPSPTAAAGHDDAVVGISRHQARAEVRSSTP